MIGFTWIKYHNNHVIENNIYIFVLVKFEN